MKEGGCMRSILLVDDEKKILSSLSRAFFDTDYDIYTANGGEEALELLETQEVDLIISDMRMPVMDGYELLSKVKEKYPRTIRVIMSGYAEEQTIIQALVRNIGKIYILKPWNNEEVLRYVEQLFVTEDMLRSKELLALINNIDELPTISESYQKILSLLNSDVSVKEIAEEIGKDFAISSKLLQIVNSAFFGVKTGSIQQVAVYLGLQNIRHLILSTSVLNSMSGLQMNETEYKMLWDHAFRTNIILSFLYENFLHQKLPETAISAGLLHNIGWAIINQLPKKGLAALMQKQKETNKSIVELEIEEFQISHQEIGAYLLNWWELPFPIVEAALYHHDPLNENILHPELVSCVHIAQKYAWNWMGHQEFTPFFQETFARIDVSQEAFEKGLQDVLYKKER